MRYFKHARSRFHDNLKQYPYVGIDPDKQTVKFIAEDGSEKPTHWPSALQLYESWTKEGVWIELPNFGDGEE